MESENWPSTTRKHCPGLVLSDVIPWKYRVRCDIPWRIPEDRTFFERDCFGSSWSWKRTHFLLMFLDIGEGPRFLQFRRTGTVCAGDILAQKPLIADST